MANKTDLRYQKTEMFIKDTFKGLLREKSVQEVTISEVVKKAEINRTTFYAHFSGKEALLRSVQIDLVEKVSQTKITQNPEMAGQILQNDLLLKTNIFYMLGNIYREKEEFYLLFHGQEGCLRALWADYVFDFWMAQDMLDKLAFPKPYALSIFEGVFLNLIITWMEGNFETPVEEIAAIFDSVLPPMVEILFSK